MIEQNSLAGFSLKHKTLCLRPRLLLRMRLQILRGISKLGKGLVLEPRSHSGRVIKVQVVISRAGKTGISRHGLVSDNPWKQRDAEYNRENDRPCETLPDRKHAREQKERWDLPQSQEDRNRPCVCCRRRNQRRCQQKPVTWLTKKARREKHEGQQLGAKQRLRDYFCRVRQRDRFKAVKENRRHCSFGIGKEVPDNPVNQPRA